MDRLHERAVTPNCSQGFMNAENSGKAARAKRESPVLAGVWGVWISTLERGAPGRESAPSSAGRALRLGRSVGATFTCVAFSARAIRTDSRFYGCVQASALPHKPPNRLCPIRQAAKLWSGAVYTSRAVGPKFRLCRLCQIGAAAGLAGPTPTEPYLLGQGAGLPS